MQCLLPSPTSKCLSHKHACLHNHTSGYACLHNHTSGMYMWLMVVDVLFLVPRNCYMYMYMDTSKRISVTILHTALLLTCSNYQQKYTCTVPIRITGLGSTLWIRFESQPHCFITRSTGSCVCLHGQVTACWSSHV